MSWCCNFMLWCSTFRTHNRNYLTYLCTIKYVYNVKLDINIKITHRPALKPHKKYKYMHWSSKFSETKNIQTVFFTIRFTLNNSVTKWYFSYVTQQSVINADTSLTYYMSAYDILLLKLMARSRVGAPL